MNASRPLPTTTPSRSMFLKRSMILTVAIAALVGAISLSGVFFLEATYAREVRSWALQAVGQDIANLISIPILLAAGYFAFRGSAKGFAVWLGVLLFLIYAFVIYAFDVHYNNLFLGYVAVLGLSFYTFLDRMIGINFESFCNNFFTGSRMRRPTSILLMIVAVLFYVQWLSQDIPAVLSNQAPADVIEIGIPTNPVHVLDLGFFLPAMIITSILLWKGRPAGFLFAAPLLIFAILTGAGILFANALIRLEGAAVSYVPDAIIGTICIMSIILTWLYLSEIRKEETTKDVASGELDKKGSAAA